MRRKLQASLLSLSIIAPLVAFSPHNAPAQRRTTRRPASPVRDWNARVAQLADSYLKAHYSFNPTAATAAGLHELDAQLETRSAEAITREIRRLRASLAELSRVPEWRLSPE